MSIVKIQLAAVAKRIESSRALLEEAKSRVSEIRLRARQDSARCRSYRQIYTHVSTKVIVIIIK